MRYLAVLAVSACLSMPAVSQAEMIYGITENQFLVTFDSSAPSALLSSNSLSGLQSNETVLGIDFRPATGELFALGSSSRLYKLNTSTGMASQVGAGPFMPPINGAAFGFDFNPVIDRIRLDSDVNKNYVLNPNDGTATVVTDLFYGMGDPNQGKDPNVVSVGYTNSALGGASSTQLYGIDTGLDILVTQANSAGTLGTVGSLNADITAIGGFDISGVTDTPFLAAMTTNSSRSTLWSIDLTTGAGTLLGEIGGGLVITSLAVSPSIENNSVPEPSATLLAGLAVVFGGWQLRNARKQK